MTSLTIAATAYSVQSAKPAQPYGQLPRLPVGADTSVILLRAALHRIPAGATVTSARLEFTEWSDEGGSRSLRLLTVDSSWNSNVTWGNRPSTDVEVDTVALPAPQRGDTWSFDARAEVQEVVSGHRVDRGWQLEAVTNALTLRGSSASLGGPQLVVEYTTVPQAPENQHPASGVVSLAKPVLTFDADDSIIGLQVQIDAAMDEVTPDFDSGAVAAGGGHLDLARTDLPGGVYPGLADGATTSWRVRQQTGGGWSDWSEWVSFSRLAKSALPITNPGATSDDGTPPVTWTFAGTQVAWRARLLDAQGKELDDSGYTPGTDTDWTPERGLTRDGQHGTIDLRVWDDEERVATPGDPEYVQTLQAITYTLDPTVDPVSGLTASQVAGVPDVILTGHRGEISDQVDVFRNGDRIARYDGTEVFNDTAFLITDVFPPVGKPLTYRVAPRVNGKTASGGPKVTITPRATGIWLVDLETGDRVVFRGDPPEQAQPETAIVHMPLRQVAGEGQVVRRRLVRYRPQGTVKGTLGDYGSPQPGVPDAETCEALLRDWAEFDAGHPFRVVYLGFDRNVIIGDLLFTEVDNPKQEKYRVLDVSFNYWGQVQR